MDHVQEAWDAWDRARRAVATMLNQATVDATTFGAAEGGEWMARRRLYKIASERFGVVLPFVTDQET